MPNTPLRETWNDDVPHYSDWTTEDLWWEWLSYEEKEEPAPIDLLAELESRGVIIN
jgi:hypothetical protein